MSRRPPAAADGGATPRTDGTGRGSRDARGATPRTGRRPGSSGAREAILDAARSRFSATGYDRATIRGIAADAGVDPALVHHYFGNKSALFTAAIHMPFNPADVIPGLIDQGRDGIGERLVRLFLRVWDASEDRSPLFALIRSAVANPQATEMTRQYVASTILRPVAEALGSPDADLRASLAASQMLGLAIARYIVGIEPLASADPDTVVAAVAPTLQRYLTGDLDPGRVS